ncbi:MAG: Mor transcription activator family protein [Oscillibacter sp.]
MEKWTETITIDMLPEQYQPLADVIGVQQLLSLAEKQGGSNMYIPKMEALVRTTRDRQIKEKFNGYNAEELAHCYGMTVRWVQEICKDSPPPGQLTLDDIWSREAE